MTKVIALSAVLGLSALGMACGDGATNANVNINAKPANTNVAPVSSPVTVASPVNTAPANNGTTGNSMNSNMKPANGMTTNSNMKPANTTASPAATKKP